MSFENALSYLALGDSYTVGEGVTGGETWTSRMILRLRDQGISISFPRVIATTGWTCDELSAAMDTAMPPLEPTYDLVSLLIGVNDQYRSYPRDEYVERFSGLLDRAISLAQGRADRVLVLSIPDWSVTPFASALEPARDLHAIAEDIDIYNATAQRICESRGVAFVDHSHISRELSALPQNLTSDQLHPGSAVYDAWAELAAPVAARLLSS